MRSATCCYQKTVPICSIQLVSARYEKGAMVLTSNRTFSKWAKVFGNSVVASALLDWSRVEHIGHGFVMDVRCPIA